MDLIGLEHRWDGCHFAATGRDLAAQAWFDALSQHPVKVRHLSQKPTQMSLIFSRVTLMFSRAGMKSLVKQSTYLVKQSILRELDRRGYVLLKKSGNRAPPAQRPGPASRRVLYRRLDFVEPALVVEFQAVCGRLDGLLGIPPRQAYAVYCAARDLAHSIRRSH